jgi:hypothetical protein
VTIAAAAYGEIPQEFKYSRTWADDQCMTLSRRGLGLVMCFALTALASPLASQSTCTPPATIAGDRPGNLTGPAIVPNGSVQVETGVGYARSSDATLQTLGATLLRVGVTCRVEARFATSGYLQSSASGARSTGLGDSWLGSKIGVIAGGGFVPQLSILAGSVVPSRSVHSRHSLEPEANLTASWTLPRGQSLLAFSGVARRADGDARVAEQLQGASWWVPIGGLVPFLEYSQISRANAVTRMIGTGLTLFPIATVQVDGSVIVPVGPGASGAMLGLGISRRW